MNLATLLLATGLAVSSVSSMAMDNAKKMDMKSMDMKVMDPKMMDKDGDGMISRSEFMSAHEMMFDHMKNSQDMISVKDMQKMKRNMMMGGSGMSENTPGMSGPNDKNLMGITKP